MTHCYYHSSKEAEHLCVQCQKDVCSSCIILVEGEPFCQMCWEMYTLSGTPEDLQENTADNETTEAVSILWHDRKRVGFIRAFFLTTRDVTLKPKDFFKQLLRCRASTQKAILPPLLFALICTLLFWLPMNVIYIKYIFPPMVEMMAEEEALQSSATAEPDSLVALTQRLNQQMQAISYRDIAALSINYFISYIILASCLQHILIGMFNRKAGFSETLQVRCYAMAVQCLWLVPLLGWLLAEIGSVIICMLGFRVVQKLTVAQSLLVASVPVVMSLVSLLTLV